MQTRRISIARRALFLIVTAVIATASVHAQIDAFYDDFSNGNAQGWTLGPDWEIGPAVPVFYGWGCGYSGDPAVDGDGVLGGGIAGNFIGGFAPAVMHPSYTMESPTIWLEPGVPATLSFKRWLGVEYPPYRATTIDVFDGSQWVTIWAVNQYQCFVETAWQTVSYDVSAYANPGFRFRFTIAGLLPALDTVPGWNIDNVRVSIPTSATTRFADDFSNGNSRGWTMGQGWQIGPAIPSVNTLGCGTGDPAGDADGAATGGIAGVVIGGNLSTQIGNAEQSLISPRIRLQPATRAILYFSRWLQTSFSPFVNSSVAVFDGTQWVTLFQTTAISCTIDQAWTNVGYDVTPWANADFRFKISYSVAGPNVVPVPSWSIDNVLVVQFVGQANSPEATLVLNGVGAMGIPGPFVQEISNATGFNLAWQGPGNQSLILVGSATEGPHESIAGIGKIDVGTRPTFADVFVIIDGLSYPAAFYATLDPAGFNTMGLSAAGIPVGTTFFIQGFVTQFGTPYPAPFKSTAAHLITKI